MEKSPRATLWLPVAKWNSTVSPALAVKAFGVKTRLPVVTLMTSALACMAKAAAAIIGLVNSMMAEKGGWSWSWSWSFRSGISCVEA